MKNNATTFIASIIGLLMINVLLSGCSDDDATSRDPDAIRLQGTWEVQMVTLNSFDVTNPEYTDFIILFREDGSYFTQDGDPVFTENGGFWRFETTDNIKTLIMDGTNVSYAFTANDNQVSISFFAAGGRIGTRSSGLDGDYRFDLIRTDKRIE